MQTHSALVSEQDRSPLFSRPTDVFASKCKASLSVSRGQFRASGRPFWSQVGIFQPSSYCPLTDSDSTDLSQPLLHSNTGEMAISKTCRDDKTIVSLRSTPPPTVIWPPRVRTCLLEPSVDPGYCRLAQIQSTSDFSLTKALLYQKDNLGDFFWSCIHSGGKLVIVSCGDVFRSTSDKRLIRVRCIRVFI